MEEKMVSDLLMAMGRVEATLERHSEDLKTVKETLLGNGHPENSVVSKLDALIKSHNSYCPQLENRVGALEDDKKEAEIKKEMEPEVTEKIKKEFFKKILKDVFALFKKNPVAAAIYSIIAGALGLGAGTLIDKLSEVFK